MICSVWLRDSNLNPRRRPASCRVASILFSLALVPLSTSRATAGELRRHMAKLFRVSRSALAVSPAAFLERLWAQPATSGFSVAQIATMMTVTMFGGLLLQWKKLSDH